MKPQPDQVLIEAERLHKLGAAIIWLYPKSKKPIGNGWTTGPRKEWNELARDYVRGNNVGMRLGTPSAIDFYGYLAVVDLDIKKPEGLAPALERLEQLFVWQEVPDWKDHPYVATGRGNGSLHIYILTSEPFKMITVGKNDAYEICIYSDGRQCVLPPSIHPITGNAYQWKRGIENASSLHHFVLPERGDSGKKLPSRERKSKAQNREPITENNLAIDETLDIRWYPGVSD